MIVIIATVTDCPKLNRLNPDYYQIPAIDSEVAKQKQFVTPRKNADNWISHNLS